MCVCVSPGEGASPDTRFIEDGVCELLKTRRVLKCSYPYGFFLQPRCTQKEIFELMQVSVRSRRTVRAVCGLVDGLDNRQLSHPSDPSVRWPCFMFSCKHAFK